MAIENNNLYYTFFSSSPVNVHFIAESEFEVITKNILEYIKNLRKIICTSLKLLLFKISFKCIIKKEK